MPVCLSGSTMNVGRAVGLCQQTATRTQGLTAQRSRARQVLESIRNFDRGPADRQSGPDRLIADQSLDSAVNFSAELPSRFSLLNPGAPAPRRLFVDFAIIALHPIKPIGQA